MLYRIEQLRPTTNGPHFVADGACVIGDVRLGRGASVWFHAVLRADNDLIEIGEDCNIQDHAVLHVDEGEPIRLGRGVSIAHHAVLHGCEIGEFSLVGINSVVLNRARIGRYCVVGAGSLVPEGMVVPDGSLVFGNPARVLRHVDEAARADLEAMAARYRTHAEKCLSDLAPLDERGSLPTMPSRLQPVAWASEASW